MAALIPVAQIALELRVPNLYNAEVTIKQTNSCGKNSPAAQKGRWGAYFLLACLSGCIVALPTSKISYPATVKVTQIDDYHGTKVADPYRWLEDDNSPETKAWVEAQNKATFAYLNEIPERKKIKRRLTQLWNYERYGVPVQFGGHYFYTKNDGLQNQSILYSADSLEAASAVLLDANKLSNDGTVALSGTALTEDGNFLAYGVSVAGSDWQEWKVRDVRTKEDRVDHIQWVKFSGASWTKDGNGFFTAATKNLTKRRNSPG